VAAKSEVNVLIIGETGTGKELLARAIHINSSRSHKNLVTLDCAALPESLVSSMLFGHVKGAFTGAVEEQQGLIKQADGSTLFLDEVGELPLALQKNFLRVLQEHRFRPLGGKQELSSAFRLIAATNRDLERLAAAGQFRQDLLFRLRTLTIKVPPLRQRRSDIKELALHYVAKICERNQMGLKGMSPDFYEILLNYSWPGNVRELIHALEAAIARAGIAPTLIPPHLPPHIRLELVTASILQKTAKDDMEIEASEPRPLPTFREARRQTVEALEKSYLQELMTLSKGKILEACRVSGLSQSHLYNLLKKHRIFLSSHA
jgi:two-component system NtrC family response regulator